MQQQELASVSQGMISVMVALLRSIVMVASISDHPRGRGWRLPACRQAALTLMTHLVSQGGDCEAVWQRWQLADHLLWHFTPRQRRPHG